MNDPNAIRQAWFSPDGAVGITTLLGGAWGVLEWFRSRTRKKQDELDAANAKVKVAEDEKRDAQLAAARAAQDREIELLKDSKDTMWRRYDDMFAALQKTWTRDDQEKYRMEMTNDIRSLREELRQDFQRLQDHFDDAVRKITSKGE